jgi:hypothetical protein
MMTLMFPQEISPRDATVLGYRFCSNLRDSGKILKKRCHEEDPRIRRRKELVGKAEDPPASAMSPTYVLGFMLDCEVILQLTIYRQQFVFQA